MEYHPLDRTDPKVSALCLGTMTQGEQNSGQDAFAQIARAKAAGINFMDIAGMYPTPPRTETYASTERIIGNRFRRNGDHVDWILTSKIAGPGSGISHVRDGNLKFNRQRIVAALDASLEHLQTDWLDLCQLHWPEQRTNFFGQLGCQHQEESFTPLEETLGVLNEQVRAGKIRHIGLSNETPRDTMTFFRLARERGWSRAVSIQNPYNLLNRSFEVGLAEIAIREQCGPSAYSPMAFDILSDRYTDGARLTNTHISLYSRSARYTNPRAEAACARYVAPAREHGLEPAQMALACITSRPFVTGNIIGATLLRQLEANPGNVDLGLDEGILTGIDAIHREQPNPVPWGSRGLALPRVRRATA